KKVGASHASPSLPISLRLAAAARAHSRVTCPVSQHSAVRPLPGFCTHRCSWPQTPRWRWVASTPCSRRSFLRRRVAASERRCGLTLTSRPRSPSACSRPARQLVVARGGSRRRQSRRPCRSSRRGRKSPVRPAGRVPPRRPPSWFWSLAEPVVLLVVASLLSRNIKSRLLLRDPEKASALFGKQDESVLQVYKADTRNPNDLDPLMFEGVTHVICCTGTTAFPSKRWDGENTPERVDWDGIRNLVSALPQTIKRLVLVSSIGVTKYNEIPWSIMNLFGVLKYKKMGEDFVRNSGIPFTIIRPGRLTDGPYTSYDLNTLLKATAGERRAVVIGKGDKLVGEVSRLVVAEACIQALDIESTEGQIYEINSVKVLIFFSRTGTLSYW
uniref:NAD(P)-binding domain-containing protein n=2 Tax=Zea mays TaxID=4577 RepID=A0A804LKH0_MAIZE